MIELVGILPLDASQGQFRQFSSLGWSQGKFFSSKKGEPDNTPNRASE